MSVTEKGKVDGIATTKDGNGIVLLISDHLEWKDEYKHLVTLQDKINAYISFMESGQYKKVYKGKKFKYGIIEIHFLYEPTEKAEKFLNTVQEQVRESGIQIRAVVSGDGD